MNAYYRWLKHPKLNSELKEELMQLNDPQEIEDRFHQSLPFGTAGLRGKIGAGTNRMNIYTVRRATEGFTRYLFRTDPHLAKKQGVVIAYDPRRQSQTFAHETAGVFAYHGIPVYLFSDIRPTPMLSFAVRYLQAVGGVMITASHNPPEYNGYKVYGPDGGQLLPDAANQIYREMEQIQDEINLPSLTLEQGLKNGSIRWVPHEVDESYFSQIQSLPLRPDILKAISHHIRIVYTPLHGTGHYPVRRMLTQLGFSQLSIVQEQAKPDPAFSTVPIPNPEDPSTFQLALQYAKKQNADLVMATDPDADRLGVMVYHQGEYIQLNGNQLGALMLHYLLSQKSAQQTIPTNAIAYKTIVTSELGRKVANSFGVPIKNLLTGFKYIAEQIRLCENRHPFIFGYEESDGYLIHDFVRDKDAIQASILVAEMVAYYKKQNLTLIHVLESLFDRFGYHQEALVSFRFAGIKGQQQMKDLLQSWRQHPPTQLGHHSVIQTEDYIHGLHGLPPANVIKFLLDDEAWVVLRPSGTEPKMKCYIGVCSQTKKKAKDQLLRLQKDLSQRLKHWQ